MTRTAVDYSVSSMHRHKHRLLLITHLLDPQRSMESRLSWYRAVQAASHYPTMVVCAESSEATLQVLECDFPNLQVLLVPHTRWEQRMIHLGAFYFAYRSWHRRVLRLVRTIHRTQPFSLVHQVSYCGYREPGECWKLGVPFIWGPIGGTQNFPVKFLTTLGLLCALREAFRNLINYVQIRYSLRVWQALNAAHTALAANYQVQSDFENAHGVQLPVQLETGLDRGSHSKRKLRDEGSPLRILWAGRLECWKALPLLYYALVRLPEGVTYELRVLGDGRLARKWKAQAERLGIARNVQWVGWPPYSGRVEHYEWADVFAFTSLRDTSGTGLLESLAAGVPIVGLNHQGAADIMTPKCAIPIPVESPRQVVDQLGRAILRLATNPQELKELSDNALVRARDFCWDSLAADILEIYADVLAEEIDERPLPQLAVNRPRLHNRTSTVAG